VRAALSRVKNIGKIVLKINKLLKDDSILGKSLSVSFRNEKD